MRTGILSRGIGLSPGLLLKRNSFIKKFKGCKILLLMVMPTIIYYILFHYLPMWGVLIAFKDFNIFKGFAESPWVGLKYFRLFFSNPDSFRLIRNTIILSLFSLIWGFPVPIIFSLMMNEIRGSKTKKLVQTVSYMPHFISTVVVASMITMILSPSTGLVNNLLDALGFERIYFMGKSSMFRTIYIASGIWQNMGWNSIIYLTAITNVDQQLYESAVIDGAGKFKQIIYITIPCIASTIITLFLLNLGSLMNVGFEKAFLLQSPGIYETSDVIQTFVYRQGIRQGNFSYASAIGFFNSAVNVLFLTVANFVSKRISKTSLW